MKARIDSWQNYPLDVRKLTEDEGGGWVARIPALGRKLFKGRGETSEEAIKNLEELAGDILLGYQDRGVELPEPPIDEDEYSGKILVRLPRKLHSRLSGEALQDGVSLNTYIVSILSDSLRAPSAEKIMRQIQRDLLSIEKTFTMNLSQPDSSKLQIVTTFGEKTAWTEYCVGRTG